MTISGLDINGLGDTKMVQTHLVVSFYWKCPLHGMQTHKCCKTSVKYGEQK